MMIKGICSYLPIQFPLSGNHTLLSLKNHPPCKPLVSKVRMEPHPRTHQSQIQDWQVPKAHQSEHYLLGLQGLVQRQPIRAKEMQLKYFGETVGKRALSLQQEFLGGHGEAGSVPEPPAT